MKTQSETSMLTIGQVAERTGVAPSALRFYEDRGLISSARTGGNQRRYHRSVLRRVSLVRIAQTLGLSLQEISDELDALPREKAPTKGDWNRLSRHWRSRLDQRIEQLVLLRDRLNGCIGCGCLSLDKCALYNRDDSAAELGAGPRYLLGDVPDNH